MGYHCITIFRVETTEQKCHVCRVEALSRQEEQECCGGKATTVLVGPSVDATLDQH